MPELWKPTSVIREQWGLLQLVINGEDRTWLRGAPIIIEEWSSGDPFDDASAMLSLPQVTPFDELGQGELEGIFDGSHVDINLVRPNGSVKRLWEGLIVSYHFQGAGLQLQCIGHLYQMDFYAKQPRFYTKEYKYEDLIRFGFGSSYPLVTEFPSWWTKKDDKGNNITGHATRWSGNWQKVLTGYINELLSLMLDDTGFQWTLMKNPGRQPVLKLKEMVPLNADWTIAIGQRGVDANLTRDLTQSVTMVYGQGVDQAGGTWRNAWFSGPQGSTYYDPLFEHPEQLDRWEVGAGLRVEKFHDFNQGVSLEQAKADARKMVWREAEPGWVGTITLTADPHEGSRFEMKAGGRLRLNYFGGAFPSSELAYSRLFDAGIYLQRATSGSLTRGQFITVLLRLLLHHGLSVPAAGSHPFTDIAGNTHETAIRRLYAAGIALGYDDSTFRPNEAVTRQAAASFVARAAEWATGDTIAVGDPYPDTYGNVHETNIRKCRTAGIFLGYGDGTFKPTRTLPRLTSATVMLRLNRYLGGTIAIEDEHSTLFHIAEVVADTQGGTVTLRVDTKARDLLTVSEIQERNRDSRTPLKLQQVNTRSHMVEDRYQPWDTTAGSGIVPPEAVEMPQLLSVKNFKDWEALTKAHPPSNADFTKFYAYVNGANADRSKRWTKVIVPMAERINVRMTEFMAVNASGTILKTKFHASVYADIQVHPYDMPRDASGHPDPFTEDAFDATLPDPDGDRQRPHESLIIGWGDDDQAAGYWPGLESRGNPVTGLFKDEATWQHTMPRHYYHVAVMLYATVNCYIIGRFHPGIEW